MEREEVFALTSGCYNGEPATCMAACPFHVDIKSFLKKIEKGRIGAAALDLNKALPFPRVVCEICPHPCEDMCQRSTVLKEETIAIHLLEKACIYSKENRERKSYQLPPLEQRVAVVGAGIVGLSAALYLARKRFPVVVYEMSDGWGGEIRKHPLFSVFEAEFVRKFESMDVEFRFHEEISDLSQVEGYDAVLLATGKKGRDFGLLDGWDAQLGATNNAKVFMTGEVAGLSQIEGMAHTFIVTKAMESYLQTGNPEHAAMNWQRTLCSQNVPHTQVAPMPHVVPVGELYTKEEAQKEAARCMQCDCEECMKSCELLQKYKKKPPRIVNDVVQDGMTRNSVSSACITRQTWSCNQCGHCASVCSESVDIGGLFELSRTDRVASGNYPPAFHGYWLEEMEHASKDAAIVKAAPKEKTCQYVFFPGCRLGASNPEYVLQSYEILIRKQKSTGIILNCCGIPALWAGEKERFDAHIEDIKNAWEELGEPVVIYACASCRKTFERFMPEIPTISLYELLDGGQGYVETQEYAVFDACAAYGMKEVKQAVRNLAASCGCHITDYDSEGKCCGFGGHIQLANPEFFDEVAETRCAQTDKPFLVYCTNCKEVFQNHGKKAVHILDLLYNLEGAKVPTLEEKRLNNLLVKQMLLSLYWKEEFSPQMEEWDSLKVKVVKETKTTMERTLIPLRDVKKTIWINEMAGEGFENAAGEVICRLVGDYLTCWVKYKKEGDCYQVLEVYSHRMHIREDQM